MRGQRLYRGADARRGEFGDSSLNSRCEFPRAGFNDELSELSPNSPTVTALAGELAYLTGAGFCSRA
jgi:hypothetical protein